MQRLPLYHPRVLERLAQLVAPQLGLLFKNGAYYVLNPYGDPTPITSASDAVRKEFVDAIAAAAARAEPLLGNAIFLQPGEVVKSLSPGVLSKIASAVGTGAIVAVDLAKKGALKAAENAVASMFKGIALLATYSQKDKIYNVVEAIHKYFGGPTPDPTPNPKPNSTINTADESREALLKEQRAILVSRLKIIIEKQGKGREFIDSEDEARQLRELAIRLANELKTVETELTAMRSKDNVPEQVTAQDAIEQDIAEGLDVADAVDANVPLDEEGDRDNADVNIEAGAKALFETDPLLFFLLNEKKVKKGKKKAKSAPPTVTEFLQPSDPNLYRTKDVIKKQSAGAPKAAKKTAWMIHVAKYAKDNGLNYFDALKKAKASYKK